MTYPYTIATDSDSDLPYDLADKMNIPVIQMPYIFDDEAYYDDNGRTGDLKKFFHGLRTGSRASTSLLSVDNYLEFFGPLLEKGDVLFLSFSSQLSSTFENIIAAQELLKNQYPERKLIVVDTLRISMPQAMLVMIAHQLHEKGGTIEEVAQWVNDNKLKVRTFFSVSDIKYLQRGGRLSPTAAAVCQALQIKPILEITDNGKIEVFSRIRGKLHAFQFISEQMQVNPTCSVMIMHADIYEDVLLLRDIIKKQHPSIKQIMILNVGPVIGAHCGPDTVACSYINDVDLYEGL